MNIWKSIVITAVLIFVASVLFECITYDAPAQHFLNGVYAE